MERRGIYRKGSSGHARNVNSYILARQKFKKWRTPLTAFVGLLIVFGAAPVVGENFQTSLLTNKETAAVAAKNPEQAKKTLLLALNDFVKDCDRFRIKDCADEGKALIAKVARTSENLAELLPAVESFELHFEGEIARKACVYDLGKVVADGALAQKNLQQFVARYGEALHSEGLQKSVQSFLAAQSRLTQFVGSCGTH